MRERSNADRQLGGSKREDAIQTKAPSPCRNSDSSTVNGTSNGSTDNDHRTSKLKTSSPDPSYELEGMSGTQQNIDVEGGRVANGQESPEIDVEIESEDTLDADSDSRKV